MPIPAYLIIAIVVFAILYFVAPTALTAFRRFRGKRLVTCPETRQPAGVDVDVKHATLTALAGPPDLRLKHCTRWPERQDCGQECLLQIELAPEECKVQHILTSWYEDKACAVCGKPFGAIHLYDHKPALLNPDDHTVEWQQLRVEQIPAALEAARPICWDCHILKTFMREHPDLVIARPARHVQQAGK
ncbi:MAG TPA: hypothetical protein VKA60_19295 [Blastocatellia bacterium]|nr:hypothetical protein [Blastocatellia bacterium]